MNRACLKLLLVALMLVLQSQTALAGQAVTIRWTTFPIWWPGITGAESAEQLKSLREAGKPSTWTEHIIAEFQKQYPNVKIEHRAIGWGEVDGLKVSLAAGVGPHVFYTYPALFGELVHSDALEPIDAHLTPEDRDEILPAALDAGLYDGKHYMWPWRINPEGLWILNRTWFENANVEHLLPQPPDYQWTVDQFVAAARAITVRDPEAPRYAINIGSTFQTSSGIDTWGTWSFLYAFGADLWDVETDSVTPALQSKIEQTFTLFRELVFGYGVSGAGSFANGTLGMAFASGQDIYRRLVSVHGSDDNLPFKVAFALPPCTEGQEPGVPGGIGGFVVSRQASGEELKWAMRLARFITEREQQLTMGTGLPIRRTALAAFKPKDPLVRFDVDHVVEYVRPYSSHVEVRRITDVWLEAGKKVVGGEWSPREAAEQYAQRVNGILGK